MGEAFLFCRPVETLTWSCWVLDVVHNIVDDAVALRIADVGGVVDVVDGVAAVLVDDVSAVDVGDTCTWASKRALESLSITQELFDNSMSQTESSTE